MAVKLEIYRDASIDVSTGKADIMIDNIESGVYIVKAIVDGLSYAKEISIIR